MRGAVKLARIAVGQLRSTSDHDKNFAAASKIAAEASAAGARMLCLPECFNFIGSSAEETLAQVDLFLDPKR